MTDELVVHDAGSITNIPPRRRRLKCCVELSSEPVENRGEPLHEIWWRGKQWAVTEYGIECLDGCYFIEANRILEEIEGDHPWPWPCHMAEKEWVDADEFATAWLVAIVLHGHGRKLSKTKVERIKQTFGKLPYPGAKY
jgi:hypothetical protein